MLLVKDFVLSLKEKQDITTLIFLLTHCPQVINVVMTDPLNTVLDDFGI